MFIVALVAVALLTVNPTPSALCSDMDQCILYVMRGNYWAIWNVEIDNPVCTEYYADLCSEGCYGSFGDYYGSQSGYYNDDSDWFGSLSASSDDSNTGGGGGSGTTTGIPGFSDSAAIPPAGNYQYQPGSPVPNPCVPPSSNSNQTFDVNGEYLWISAGYNRDCATCVCDYFLNEDTYCAGVSQTLIAVTAAFFCAGVLLIGLSIWRLSRQSTSYISIDEGGAKEEKSDHKQKRPLSKAYSEDTIASSSSANLNEI